MDKTVEKLRINTGQPKNKKEKPILAAAKKTDRIRVFGKKKPKTFWAGFWIVPKVEKWGAAKIRDIKQGKTSL